FGGGTPSDNGYYVYVKPKMCKEIVQVRINLGSDLSLTDDTSGYWIRKVASATRCPFQAEFTLYFDKGRKLTDRTIENGEFVTEEEYQAFVEAGI
ncbi:MAG: hypothetical protein AAFV93_09455, partial [Chloroflexota bacterium]